MKPKKNEELNTKYYKVNEVKVKDMVEDFLASKEEAERKSLEAEGWVEVGRINKDTTDEELEALAAALVDGME